MHGKGMTGRFTFQAIFLSSVVLGFLLILTGEKSTHEMMPFLLLVGKCSAVPASEALQVTAALGSISLHTGVSRDHAMGKGFLATCLALWSSS